MGISGIMFCSSKSPANSPIHYTKIMNIPINTTIKLIICPEAIFTYNTDSPFFLKCRKITPLIS